MTWYTNLPNAVKAAINTAWQAFIGTFGLSLIGWLHEVQEWAGDTSHSFPAVTPLGKAAAAAAVAAFSFIVTVVVRGVQQAKAPETGPHYPTE